MQTVSCTWRYVVPIGEDPASGAPSQTSTIPYHTIALRVHVGPTSSPIVECRVNFPCTATLVHLHRPLPYHTILCSACITFWPLPYHTVTIPQHLDRVTISISIFSNSFVCGSFHTQLHPCRFGSQPPSNYAKYMAVSGKSLSTALCVGLDRLRGPSFTCGSLLYLKWFIIVKTYEYHNRTVPYPFVISFFANRFCHAFSKSAYLRLGGGGERSNGVKGACSAKKKKWKQITCTSHTLHSALSPANSPVGEKNRAARATTRALNFV